MSAMTRASILLLVVAGCTFPTPSEQYACQVTPDCEAGRFCDRGLCVVGNPPADAAADTPDAPEVIDCMTFAARHFDACLLPAPGGELDLTMPGTYYYDTSSGSLTDPANAVTTVPSMIIASGVAISIGRLSVGAGSTLRAIGSSPLIVASWSTITVAGTIDAASVVALAGAGANPPGCATHPAASGNGNTNGGGGGGGGGFAAAGGRGGNGDGNAGGAGGTAIAMPLLLGGCAGNRGGNADQPGGLGGSGGGAIQLTARLGITITGVVTAGGTGGRGAAQTGNAGGGGGGSGGMVGLEAPTVSVASTGVLAANGGGGGQGATQGQAGAAGTDGLPSATRAPGGAGGVQRGTGGPGNGGAILTGGAGQNDTNDGGGGGGGGAGFIAIKSAAPTIDAAAIVSPPAQLVP